MSKRSCYVKSFDSILFLGAFIGVSQFSLANSKCLSRFSSILFIPFLASFIYLSLASYHFNTSEMLQEEVVILSYGIWTVFCVNLLATLSRFPYYFAVRCLFKRVILDVNEINKRLRMQPKYTKNTLKMWMVFFVFTSANAMVRWCADMHWSIKLAIFAGNLMYYCENMFAYKILNEMALQCERIHALMFEGLQFVQDEHNRQLKVQEQHAQQKEYRVAYLEKFQDLTQIHLEICQCAKKANNLFGAPIMSLFILDFAVVTLTLYDVCNGIVDLDLTTYDQLQLFMILGNCLQIVIIFARIIISIYSWTHLDKKVPLKTSIYLFNKNNKK